jgi:hypothetical protein
VNETIKVLLEIFLIDHIKMTTYHPKENGAFKSFNKTLHKGLTNICSINKDDWDDKIPAILWEYRSSIQNIDWENSVQASLHQEALIPLQFWTNSDKVATVEKFDERKSMNNRLYQLNKLEEERLIAIHHQEVQKKQQKVWHDHHINKKI